MKSTAVPIPDTQGTSDERRLPIQHVGVRDLKYPLTLKMPGGVSDTVATWSLAVALPADQKGTHMSRFVEWLDAIEGPQDGMTLATGLEDMLDRLHAQVGRLHAQFAFFLRKQAPVSGASSLMDYRGGVLIERVRAQGPTQVWQEVAVPVKSLCPCSKAISAYGAHNQRSEVSIRLQPLAPVSWGEMVRFAEAAASSELWGLLKRADEKWVTEHAYDNPRFVEDLVREVALRLNADARVGAYRVMVENFESIHNHSAFAVIDRGMPEATPSWVSTV